MHDSVRDNQADAQPEPGSEAASSGLLDDLGRLARAVRSLFGAQLSLLAAELGLARSAVSWLLAAGLGATIAGVGLGLTLLSLIGFLLAKWLGSWIWALAVLSVLEVLVLFGTILLFRRCMHWMSLPGTRQEWRAIMRDTVYKAERDIDTGKGV
ncbi:ABC transporter ATP-binding protein [Dyella sp.]|uniref:ABC transporter ATP-binding protein n=1 Tax=Dyella sp. TaxID=1869338 RepID=UPI002B4A0181|nr:ABC transporter ATP-binding protein [Dyella sp.]HKT27329.1 ABC transporter ATP-binding protein [Dyella sp.]